jgi:hypothetical protein
MYMSEVDVVTSTISLISGILYVGPTGLNLKETAPLNSRSTKSQTILPSER